VKLLPAKVGASPKQLGVLGGLLALALVGYLVNRTPSTPVTTQRNAPAVIDPTVPRMPAVTKRASNRAAAARGGEDFKPTLKLPDGMDVSKIDPTIKLDLLAKVHNVAMETGSRGSVFAFGQAPLPPTPPAPKILPSTMTSANMPPKPVEPIKPVEPPKPQAPPITWKFYGYSNARGGPKRAFFLDGEDISVVNENDVIKNRYKIIKIGVNSVVVEDMNFKSQQTLPLVEELPG